MLKLNKINNNQTTRETRLALEEVLDKLNTLRCNSSLVIAYNTSNGEGRFDTGFRKLYYDQNEMICVRSIIDLGVLQIVFISSVLCLGVILFIFAIPLRNDEEWAPDYFHRRRNDDFYTIDSNFRTRDRASSSNFDDHSEEKEIHNLHSPLTGDDEKKPFIS